jgi:hypothetical protein
VKDDIDPATFTPDDSPLTVTDVMTSPLYQDLSTPKLSDGDVAVDFALPRLDAAGEGVRLSDFVGQRPVALIFGSYT